MFFQGIHSRAQIAFMLWACLCALITARAEVIVFENGDRLNGILVRKEGDDVVFKTERFGEIKVPGKSVRIEPVPAPSPTVASSDAPAAVPLSVAVQKKAKPPASPPADTPEKPKPWWKEWHGNISTSMGIDSDLTERSIAAIRGKLTRSWKQDDVQLEGWYDHVKDAGNVTMDMLKFSGMWSHRFGKKLFSEYRSYYERDPITSKATQLQQQIGIGRILVNGDGKIKVRAGIAENLFNTWPTNGDASTQKSAESLFTDVLFSLPWRISIEGRCVYYFSLDGSTDAGWEGYVDFSKKLTDSFTVGFRYEVRDKNPDPRMADYQRTRFLLGYDF